MRHIVISGASRGPGAALAQGFATPGTRLFLTARSAEALAKVADLCRDAGSEVEILACDIRDPASLAPALLAFDDGAPVDLIIANAGASAGSSLEGEPGRSRSTYRSRHSCPEKARLPPLAAGVCASSAGAAAGGAFRSGGQAYALSGCAAGRGRLISPRSSLSTVAATAASSPGRR